ncbi:ABC transporter [Desulfuribacillus stibiiarsenatis]|uniref:ABC transporter n=1 Tax=Desulfuribacillus stibiiarsenatis TaxID=1390249 RepID=A0A1E5L506_9FIRM|nr:ABC transporter [Desulfuribacillus stibiiarsenatis]OEH85093.1 ABC transporter [Desulfuribacillus stibiiarsenatis]
MRVWNAILADVVFQWRQGFYYVYVFITLLYILIISQLPTEVARFVVPLVVYSDPSMIGFFFVGGIVMLEKLQGVLQYISVTPLRAREYLLAKVISLTFLAEVAGFAIAFLTSPVKFNWFVLALGIGLTSIFFTLFGFMLAVESQSINHYFLKVVPYILVLIVPCILMFIFPRVWILNIIPSVTGLKLVYGAFHGISSSSLAFYSIFLFSINGMFLWYLEKDFEQRIR